MPRRERSAMLEEASRTRGFIWPRALGGKLDHLGDNGCSDDRLGHQFAGPLRVRVVRRASKEIEAGGRAGDNVCRSEKADAVAGGLQAPKTVDPRGRMPVGDDEPRRRGG